MAKKVRYPVQKVHKILLNNCLHLFTVSRTLGGSAERLNAASSSTRMQETASSVYHVVEGSGYSQINERRVDWKKGDTFCIPSWCQYQHFAGSKDTVYLYRFDDKPQLKSLGFYRVAGEDTESYVDAY